MKKFVAFITAMMLCLCLGACGNASQQSTPGTADSMTSVGTPETSKSDEALRLGAAYDFKSYWETCTLIGDPLIGMDDTYQPAPWLIASWDVNENATEYVLHLQQGVEFSDGTLFDAEVCKYDIEVLGAAYYCNYIHTMESIVVVDEHTLKVSFSKTDLNFLKELVKIPGMPVGSLNENGTFDSYIGTGPFILADYEKDVEATLVRNEDYWNKARMPHVAQVKYLVIPDAEARVMALESGQVDVIGVSENATLVPNSSIASMRSNDNFRVLNSGEDSYDAVFSVGMNWKQGPLSDLSLRRAVAFAIDRNTLIETVYFDVPIVCSHMMNPIFDDGSGKVEPFIYDQSKAEEVLEQGGYELQNGVLLKDGVPVELTYVSTTITEDVDLAVFVQSSLQEIGIKVNIVSLDDKLAEDRLKSGDYDLTLGVYWFEPTVSALTYYGTEDAYNTMGPYGGLSFGVTNELTQLAQAVLSAQSDSELREAADAFWAANYDACPTVPFSGRVRTAIYSTQWSGFAFNHNYYVIDLSGVKRS